jgi:hypothetical protein
MSDKQFFWWQRFPGINWYPFFLDKERLFIHFLVFFSFFIFFTVETIQDVINILLLFITTASTSKKFYPWPGLTGSGL